MRQHRPNGHSSNGLIGLSNGQKHKNSIKAQCFTTGRLLTMILTALPSFWMGTQLNLGSRQESSSCCPCQDQRKEDFVFVEAKVQRLLQQRENEWRSKHQNHTCHSDTPEKPDNKNQKSTKDDKRVPFLDLERIGSMVYGMAITSRAQFTNNIDLGVPVDPSGPGASHVLLLYQHEDVLPNDYYTESKNESIIPQFTFQQATEHCTSLDVWLLDQKGQKCYALVPQLGSYQVQHFHRIKERVLGKEDDMTVDPNEPFRLAPRGMNGHGDVRYPVPSPVERQQTMSVLQRYLDSFENAKQNLDKVIISDVTLYQNSSLIVVMCNQGQSELLHNLVCCARSRGLDTSAMLVFATDQETFTFAKSLGLAAFYDSQLFGHLPHQAAKGLGDKVYTEMMMAKAICAHLVSSLDYDFLFSDVDIVWYKHPLRDYFSQPWTRKYDVIFQDDGQHTQKFAPFAANSGFYYVRNNDLSRNFLNAVLLNGDIIFATGSHQQALATVLSEHSSLYGMRVKVIPREAPDLPAGWHFHRGKRKFMKDLLTKGPSNSTIIFHMSWTESKEHKIQFFQQMTEWYVDNDGKCGTTSRQPAMDCCLKEPRYECHFGDKPSSHKCKKDGLDSDSSFW